MEAMFEIAEKEGVDIFWFDFEPPIQGLYWLPGDSLPTIGLDSKIAHNTPLLRCVMAEELGHHFTTTGSCLCRTYFNYRDRLAVSKAEYRALRWAAEYLIPKRQLDKAVRRGNDTLWTLAELFDVTEEMMEFRINILLR